MPQTQAPTPEALPSATAEVTPTPAPVLLPTQVPTQAAATPAPAPAVALIAFAFDSVESSDGVTLQGPTTTFELGKNIAWKLTLPAADGTESMEIVIADAGTGAIVASQEFTPGVGSNIFYGETAQLVSAPGRYVMRYYSDSALVGEGQFTVVEVAATPTPEPAAECDDSYPTVCIPPGPPDLDCPDVPFDDFKVRGDDPHRFDGDNDGIGCESGGGNGSGPDPTKKPRNPDSDCDPSYPTLCLPSSPDLDCSDISARRFPVRGRDPHRFDGDNDGIGCES